MAERENGIIAGFEAGVTFLLSFPRPLRRNTPRSETSKLQSSFLVPLKQRKLIIRKIAYSRKRDLIL